MVAAKVVADDEGTIILLLLFIILYKIVIIIDEEIMDERRDIMCEGIIKIFITIISPIIIRGAIILLLSFIIISIYSS
mgnify:CR=1 FL=1